MWLELVRKEMDRVWEWDQYGSSLFWLDFCFVFLSRFVLRFDEAKINKWLELGERC